MNKRQKLGEPKGLDHKPPALFLQPFLQVIVDESTRHHQNRKLRPYRFEVVSELHARPSRHIDIRNQQIDSRHGRKNLRRPLSLSRAEHPIAFMLKKCPGQRPHIRVIIHQKNRTRQRRRLSASSAGRPQKIILHSVPHGSVPVTLSQSGTHSRVSKRPPPF
jgi:hypothetical protein